MKIYYSIFKRVFDLGLSSILLILFSPIFLVLFFVILVMDGYPVVYWSDRVGVKGTLFKMPKYRTMKMGTPEVATNHLSNPDEYLTKVGPFLRKTSLDELPQLWSIFTGDMSFVGPRPALFNQYDLICLRAKNGVDNTLPGLTGWAQVNGRDNLSIEEKLKFDKEYCQKCSLVFDLRILWLTFIKVLCRSGVSH